MPDLTSGFHAPVQVDGPQESLDGSAQVGAAHAATGDFFATAHEHIFAQVKRLGDLCKGSQAHESATPGSELAFVRIGIGEVEVARDDKAKYRVAEELKALVRAVWEVGDCVQIGLVDQGIGKVELVIEVIAEQFFQLREVSAWDSTLYARSNSDRLRFPVGMRLRVRRLYPAWMLLRRQQSCGFEVLRHA